MPGTKSGFTLIEMAIVLTIVGLVIGGIMTGGDLIRAAGERAQIAQIQQYNTAVNTFYNKYHALPGDMSGDLAYKYGFQARGSLRGEGDGNNVLEGNTTTTGNNFGMIEEWGENAVFWVDLTSANGLHLNLVDGNFTVGQEIPSNSCGCQVLILSTPTTDPWNVNSYFPRAKLGRGNFVYTWSGGTAQVLGNPPTVASDQENYFSVLPITQLNAGAGGYITGYEMGITVKEAYDMDKKIDDGMAQTGRVLALSTTLNAAVWAPNATPDSVGTCFNSTSGTYSINISNGAEMNCALSFLFQQ